MNIIKLILDSCGKGIIFTMTIIILKEKKNLERVNQSNL